MMRNILIYILLNIFTQRFVCESRHEIENRLVPIKDHFKENDQSNVGRLTMDVIPNGGFKGTFKRSAPKLSIDSDTALNPKMTFNELEESFKGYLEKTEYDADVEGGTVEEAVEDKNIDDDKKSDDGLINTLDDKLPDKIDDNTVYKPTKYNDSAVNLMTLSEIYNIIKEHVQTATKNEANLLKAIEELLARNNNTSNTEEKHNAATPVRKKCKGSSNKDNSIKVRNINRDDSFRNGQDVEDDSEDYIHSRDQRNRKQRQNEITVEEYKEDTSSQDEGNKNNRKFKRDGGEIEEHNDGELPLKAENKHKRDNQDPTPIEMEDNKISPKFKRNNEDFVEIEKLHKVENSLHDLEALVDNDKKRNSYNIQEQKKRQDEYYEDMKNYHIEDKGIHKYQKRQAALTEELENEANAQNKSTTKQPYNENVEKIKVYLMLETKDTPDLFMDPSGRMIIPNDYFDESELEVLKKRRMDMFEGYPIIAEEGNINNMDGSGNGAKTFDFNMYKRFFQADSNIKPKNKNWKRDDAMILDDTYERAQEQIMENIRIRHRLCGHARKVPISNPDNCPQLTCSNKSILKHVWIDCMYGMASRVRVLMDGNTSDVSESDGDHLADIGSADESTLNLAQRMTRYECVCDLGYLMHGGDCIRPSECIIHLGKVPVVIKNYERQLGLD